MPESVSQASAETDPAGPIARPDLDPVDWDGIERILEELPPGIPILPPEDATNFSKYRHPPPMMHAPQAWKICTDAMEKYDSDLCKAYREEIDTLLVFAGLFSAVVTGFTVESYQWLQDDPSDTTNALLAQIARSLEPNGTAAVPPRSSGMGRSVSARINAYWFISLALSLSAALVSILGKQWIREFERRASDRTPKELIGVRQLKFEGLEYWKVGDIISALPMLLQLSLALFALGILELLWHLHAAVAVTVCIPTAAAVLFYLATTVLPVHQYSQRNKDGPAPQQCAYKSPQALAAIHIYQIVARAWRSLISHLPYRLTFETYIPHVTRLGRRYITFSPRDFLFWNSRWTTTWDHWDTGFYLTDRYFTRHHAGGSPFRGLHWLSRHVDERNVQEAFWYCLWGEAHSQDTHRADEYFSDYSDRETRLRRGILHDREVDPVWTVVPLWQCAMIFIPRTHIAHEFISEILIQCLPSMAVSTADYMFRQFNGVISEDRELVQSLVKAVLSYSRRHINEDISSLIILTSFTVADCPDYATQSASQWVLVLLTANWLRSPAFASHNFSIWYLTSITKNALTMLALSPENFIEHPQRLRHLPHILALAELLKTVHAHALGPATWPMPAPDDIWRYTYDREWNTHPEWEPMVMELFKISVRGVDYDTLAGTSEHTTGGGDGIARRGPPPPHAMPPEVIAVADTARSLDTAEPTSYYSADVETLSAAHLPRHGVGTRGYDARDLPLHTELEAAGDLARARTLEPIPYRDDTRASGVLQSAGAGDAVRGSLDEGTGAGRGDVPALGEQDAASDMGTRSAGGRAVAQALDRAHRTAAPPDVDIHADVPVPRPRSVARPAEAHGREEAHGEDPGRRADTDGREQPEAAHSVRAAPGSITVHLDDRSTRYSSTIPHDAAGADAFAHRETAADARVEHRDSVSAAADRGDSLASFALAGRPELSLPVELREVHRGSTTDDSDVPSARAVGRPETHDDPTARKRAGEADGTAEGPASGHALEASTSDVEPSSSPRTDAGVSVGLAISHADDQAGVADLRGPARDTGSAREAP